MSRHLALPQKATNSAIAQQRVFWPPRHLQVPPPPPPSPQWVANWCGCWRRHWCNRFPQSFPAAFSRPPPPPPARLLPRRSGGGSCIRNRICHCKVGCGHTHAHTTGHNLGTRFCHISNTCSNAERRSLLHSRDMSSHATNSSSAAGATPRNNSAKVAKSQRWEGRN